MKKLAVIGSRNFNDKHLLEETLDQYGNRLELIISGGAIGADQMAEQYARKRGIPVKVIRPDYNRYGRYAAPIKRNEEIVLLAEAVIAFWDGKTKGTRSAIEFAKKHHRKYKIVFFQPNLNKTSGIVRI